VSEPIYWAIKEEDVPTIVVVDHYCTEDYDEAEEFVAVVVRVTEEFMGETIEIDGVLALVPQEKAKQADVVSKIKYATEYATRKNYRLQIDVNAEHYHE
jgi:hypothetical protein